MDYALMGLLARKDIVVTKDYGLVAMVIGKGARALNQNGMIFTEGNIATSCCWKGISGKRSGGAAAEPKGPPKRTKRMTPASRGL